MCSWFLLCGALALAAGPDSPAAADLLPPVKIQADGKPIDVEIGHAAPYFADFDGDGLKDLLVGQFGDGKLRIYKNVGDKGKPRFAEFTWFQAGDRDGKVPSG